MWYDADVNRDFQVGSAGNLPAIPLSRSGSGRQIAGTTDSDIQVSGEEADSMEKLITRIEDGATLRFLVYDQTWTPEALEELRREHGVYFRADSAVAVMVRGKILALGMEDDSVIRFGPDAPRFHVHYAAGLMESLRLASEALLPPAEQKAAEQ